MAEAEAYHVPVMVQQVLEQLRPERGGLYLDGTLGGGGHAQAILEASMSARIIGVDQDADAVAVARERLSRFGARVRLMRANFADAAEWLVDPLAGVLLDLGLSSRHLDQAERGFSFRPGTPLDMRMAAGATGQPTAAQLLNELAVDELADLFRRYGEERRARRLAGEIVAWRSVQPFERSDDLVAVLERVFGGRLGVKDKARIFQALRIAVNDELGVLSRALPRLRQRLAPGGVVVVLAYHSLEDRLVKRSFREWSQGCICPPEFPVCRCGREPLGETLTRKPRRPTQQEVMANPRARSARLRAWRKAA